MPDAMNTDINSISPAQLRLSRYIAYDTEAAEWVGPMSYFELCKRCEDDDQTQAALCTTTGEPTSDAITFAAIRARANAKPEPAPAPAERKPAVTSKYAANPSAFPEPHDDTKRTLPQLQAYACRCIIFSVVASLYTTAAAIGLTMFLSVRRPSAMYVTICIIVTLAAFAGAAYAQLKMGRRD